MSDWIPADWPTPSNIVAGTTLRTWESIDLPIAGEPCWLEQVHESDVVVAGDYETQPKADASINGKSGFVCVVRTADCLPVLMCSPDGSVFGAAHAGWRGLVAGVIENTIAKLQADPAELLVWLGPAISQAAFEVGDEVREAFTAVDRDATVCFEANERGRWQADLYGLARQRLRAAGVVNVSGGEFCTHSDSERFYSYRRSSDNGRMFNFIGAKTP